MKINFIFLLLLAGMFNSWSQTQITGTQNFTYCYANNENSLNVFSSANSNPLNIIFNSGEIELRYDSISIYDGNGTGIPLLEGYSGDLTGYSFIARSGFLTIKIVSDSSVSCASGAKDELSYSITALSCALPEFTYTTNSNCSTGIPNDASAIFNITSMSGHASFTISIGTQTQTITSPGIYTITGLTKNINNLISINVSNDCNVRMLEYINCIVETDSCNSAYTIPVGNSDSQFRVIGNNRNAFFNYDFDIEENIYCGGDYGVWFTLTVPQGITSLNIAQFEHDGSFGDAFDDGYLSVFRGTCDNLIELGCEDNSANTFFPIIELQNLIPGEQLYILATGYWYYTGIFEIAAWNSNLSNDNFILNNAIKLFPNPATDVLTLSTDLEIQNIEVYNLLGQQVLNNKGFKEVNVSQLPTGTFIIKAQTSKGAYTSKFIKK